MKIISNYLGRETRERGKEERKKVNEAGNGKGK